MRSTTVVNRHHKIPYDVYVGRGTPWGNPYPVSEGSRESVIRRYEEYLRKNGELISQLDELQGLVLACSCAPRPCHGDILAAFADSLAETGELPRESISDRLFPEPKRPQLSFG